MLPLLLVERAQRTTFLAKIEAVASFHLEEELAGVLAVGIASFLAALAVVASWLLVVDKTCHLLVAVVVAVAGAGRGCTPTIGDTSHWPLHLACRIHQHSLRRVTLWDYYNLFV